MTVCRVPPPGDYYGFSIFNADGFFALMLLAIQGQQLTANPQAMVSIK